MKFTRNSWVKIVSKKKILHNFFKRSFVHVFNDEYISNLSSCLPSDRCCTNIQMYKCKLISNYIEHWKANERLSNERLTLPWERGQTPLQLSNQDTNTRVKAQKKAWLLPQACGPDLQGAWGDQSSCSAFCTHKWATSFWQCHIPVTLINLCVYSM